MNNLSKYLKKIYPLVMAIISYISLCLFESIKIYDILSWMIFFSFIFLFFKTNIYNKILKKEIIFLSILYSFLIIYGNNIMSIMNSSTLNSFRLLFSFKNFVIFIGIFNLIYVLLSLIVPFLYKTELKTENNNNIKYIHFVFMIIILLAWLPFFLNYFPGTLTSDSISELDTIINNFSSISDHHPVIHMLFMSIPYNIGYSLFGTVEFGVASITLTQMIIMAHIFSSTIVYIFKKNISKIVCFIILLYYAFLPVFGFYSIVMWKDVIFSGLILLLIIHTIEIIRISHENNFNFKKLYKFIFISVLCVFFRPNAIYMYYIFALVSLLIFKKHFKVFAITFIIIFGIYYLVKGPVFNYLNIKKSSSAEYIGIPLQQIGRMAYKQIEFNSDEKRLINNLIPINELPNIYDPCISDSIKFNNKFNIKEFDNNKLKYFRLWFSLVVKHPSIAMESYAISTLGYWYPNVNYWSVAKNIDSNNYNLKLDSKLPAKFNNLLEKIENRNFPILNMEWSIGLCFWIILIFNIISFKLNGIRGIYPYIPIFGIWVTMMIASPVYAEYRYVYGAFTSLPLLILSPYLIKNINIKNFKE